VVTLAAAQRFPPDFDDRDVAILEWIKADHCGSQNVRLGPTTDIVLRTKMVRDVPFPDHNVTVCSRSTQPLGQ